HNNGDTTNISVLDYPDAKMRFILNELEVAKEYRLDDILSVQDCKSTNRIKIMSIDITPTKNISFDSKNEKLTVMNASNVYFNIKFSDKISGKEFEFKQAIPCVLKKNISIKKCDTGFIHPLIALDKTTTLDNDLLN
ncbi:TPA: hypothetical protein TVQ99_001964, partial [Streptococcus equi subsp. zooepidemicus]|nr:hypothetical protein [Streptococcus equi subsp. zooepidemicus]